MVKPNISCFIFCVKKYQRMLKKILCLWNACACVAAATGGSWLWLFGDDQWLGGGWVMCIVHVCL